ncbi:hypothetical protein LTR22_017767 [Elasticomyces elasticus]|nr:hypothetical protein LTR22_017767 [Elasticomyces elasticus]
MPKTFQDAIVVAKALDIEYLWIDALNIIQDDEEDWQREATKMADIYRNAESELHDMAGYWPAGHGVEEVRAKLSKPLEGHRWINIEEWSNLIEEFTSRQLTIPSDRLPALAGVVAKVLGERDETYLGGLWKSHLPWNLLWYTIQPEDPTTLGSGLQRSPSFAWCSVGTVIKHHRFLGPGTEYETLVYITTAACFPKSQVNLHGSVSWGYVALQGTLFTAELSWESSEGRLPYWRVTFIQDLWITPPHMPIPDRALEDSEKFQLAFDVHVVARRDGDKQPYLCRCRTDLDDKPSTTIARATLLLVGSKKPGTSRRLAGPSNGCLYFLILSPSTRLKNIAPEYQTFERLGLYVVKYGPGGISVLSNRMYQNICLM